MKSQIKNKKNQKYKFAELLIPTLNKFISYQLLLVLLEGANHEQSSQNNESFLQQFRRMVVKLPIVMRKSTHSTLK